MMVFNNIILMKYGVHASESTDAIIARKMKGISESGKMFWGYGGSICDPKTQVRPFVKTNLDRGEPTYLLLVKTKSELRNLPERMKDYSETGHEWERIPEKINILGSKYALVCSSLNKCNFDLDLYSYRVALGKSANKFLAEYVQGRVDKALCG